MTDDLVRKRSRRILRLGLLVILVVMIAAIALLLPWSRDAIGVEAAEGLLQQFKERGESYSHVVSILGQPWLMVEEDIPGGQIDAIWEYPKEGFLEKESLLLKAQFQKGKITLISKEKSVVSGSALWQQRWKRVKDRLMIGN